MAASSKISAKFTSDTKGLEKGVATVVGKLSALTQKASKTNTALERIAKLQSFQVFTQVAGWVSNATRSVVGFGDQTRQAIDASAKAARNLGLTYAEFEGLSLAASEAGVGTEKLFDAMKDLTKNTAAAAAGSGPAVDAFKKLGLSADELSRMDADERLGVVLDALAGVENQTERTALAMQILGESGIRMGSLIAGGSAGLRDAARAAEELGLNLTELQASNVEAMNDSLGRVYASFVAIANQIAANIAPAITGIAKAWEGFARNVGGAEIGKYISDALFDALEYAASWVDTVVGFFEGVFELLGGQAAVWEAAGLVWLTVWEMADRVWKLADALWSVMMSGFNKILENIVWAAKKLLEAADYIPGVDTSGLVKGLDATERYFRDGAESWGERAGEKFGDAISPVSRSAERESGSLEKMIEGWRKQSDAARTEEKKREPLAIPQESADSIAEAVTKAASYDARSTAGSDYILAQISAGMSRTLEREQLSAIRQVAKNTEKQFSFAVASLG